MVIFTYQLPKSLSFDNFAEVEADILNQLEGHNYDEIVLDAKETNYISSAGLRVVLNLKKKYDKVSVINASIEVYDIFEMTGFTNIVNVEKALREVSVEGCKIIGKGAHGIVYSTAPDTIVKVYELGSSLEDINREIILSYSEKGLETSFDWLVYSKLLLHRSLAESKSTKKIETMQGGHEQMFQKIKSPLRPVWPEGVRLCLSLRLCLC